MAHYYSEKQTSKTNLKKINIILKNIQFELYSGSGVFSKDKLDLGSKLLIENAIVNGRILDLGCGYGVVGISLKKMYPELEVLMTDINERAVELSKRNVKLHKLDIEVKKSDLYTAIKGKFNSILVNPPQTAGKEICFELIEQAPNYLEKKGKLQLVARHQKGGKDLEKKMKEIFGNVEQVVKGSGYRVYVSKYLPIKP